GGGVAGRATARVLLPEHEWGDEQWRAAPEEVGQRGAALVGLEAVVLLDPAPRQLTALPRPLVALAGQLLLGLEQPEPGVEPLLRGPRRVMGHRLPPASNR